MKIQQLANNRRASKRTRCGFTTWYSGVDGKLHKACLINISSNGARIATAQNLKVGDQISLLTFLRCGTVRRLVVEVRWTKTLPGGVQHVAGLQNVALDSYGSPLLAA